MQADFDAAVAKLESSCDELAQVVQQMEVADDDGKLEANDDTLADLAACAAVTARTLTLFLTDTGDEYTEPKPPPDVAPASAPKSSPSTPARVVAPAPSAARRILSK